MNYKKIAVLSEVLKESKKKPLFIFKHSSTCPASASAKAQVDMYLRDEKCFDVYLLIIQNQRELSNEIEAELGVQHQSPQLIFIRDGESVFNLRHFEITLENIEKHLK